MNMYCIIAFFSSFCFAGMSAWSKRMRYIFEFKWVALIRMNRFLFLSLRWNEEKNSHIRSKLQRSKSNWTVSCCNIALFETIRFFFTAMSKRDYFDREYSSFSVVFIWCYSAYLSKQHRFQSALCSFNKNHLFFFYFHLKTDFIINLNFFFSIFVNPCTSSVSQPWYFVPFQNLNLLDNEQLFIMDIISIVTFIAIFFLFFLVVLSAHSVFRWCWFCFYWTHVCSAADNIVIYYLTKDALCYNYDIAYYHII